ncbi:hypothetical protein AcV7_004358 [Taiwanofungus camphoratus]|nr:hypothetical protein AcV7_004358 [Antrodia cinnamomea]
MPNDIPPELLVHAAFPLPFRVLSLAGLGILGWATNLHGLYLAGLDARAVLDLDAYDYPRRRPVSPLPGPAGWKLAQGPTALYRSLYRLFAAYALWVLLAWAVFRHATGGDVLRADAFKFVPAVAALVLLTVLVCPFDVCARAERDRFLHAVQRCLFPPRRRVHFTDVVFADVLTSFAKVLGDLWLSTAMLMPGGSLFVQPVQEGWKRWVLPTLMSLPYAVRLRQCLIEYRSSAGGNRQQLFNALKYATSFPVIYLSAAQRIVVRELVAEKGEVAAREPWHGEHALFRLWLLAAVVNSLYSFWWDVTHDWGFDLLLPRSYTSDELHTHQTSFPPRALVLPRLHSRAPLLAHHSPPSSPTSSPTTGSPPPVATQRYPYGLRAPLLFPLAVYPFAIVADLVLRLTWSAKLSSHLHAAAEGDLLIFAFELAEVVRRWMWVFLRVEWEVVKEPRAVGARSRSPPAGSGEDEYEMVRAYSEPGLGR